MRLSGWHPQRSPIHAASGAAIERPSARSMAPGFGSPTRQRPARAPRAAHFTSAGFQLDPGPLDRRREMRDLTLSPVLAEQY